MNSFIERIYLILEYYKLSAAEFSKEINVQRSIISHIFSGRNKPSLDFILKIHNRYSDISLEWLILGKGDFLPKQKTSLAKENQNPPLPLKNTLNKKIEKIVVLYSDKSFETYQ